jgi:hypothetical protein
MPPRKTPLKARTPLRRTSAPVRRNGQDPCQRFTQALERSRQAPQPRRDTGPSSRARRIVQARFGGRCAGCGRYLLRGVPKSCQHRQARGVGGGNGLPNLVDLCGTATFPPGWCHPLCEQREQEMEDRGLVVRSGFDPALIPVRLWDGRSVFLVAGGGYITEAPAGAA